MKWDDYKRLFRNEFLSEIALYAACFSTGFAIATLIAKLVQ